MESTLGKRITANRKRLGFTQDQLAEQLGITAQAVSKWENDLSCPDITMLPKLADIFCISIDALLGREPSVPVCETEVVTEENPKENGFSYDSDSGIMDFHWGGMKLEGIGLACWVLVTGLLYLTVQFMPFDISFWNILWPSFLFIFGVFGLYPKFSGFRLGCGLFGAYWLLCKFQILPAKLSNGVWVAVAVVLFGLGLLANMIRKVKRTNAAAVKNGCKSSHKKVTQDYQVSGSSFTYDASFGDSTQYVEMETLHSGSISVNFGDFTVDLRGVSSVENGCTLSADCCFGQLTLLVPCCYTVIPDSSTSFASFEIKGTPDSNPKGTVRLTSSVDFGTLLLRYL